MAAPIINWRRAIGTPRHTTSAVLTSPRGNAMDDRVREAIEAMESSTGTRPGYRRAHARGLVVRGSFRARPEAAALTTAEHFQGTDIPVVARLSNAAGNPFAPDRDSDTVGKALGFGTRFQLGSGAVAAWAAVSLPAFPARTPGDFLRVTRAQKPLFGIKPNPLKILAYLASRPSIFPTIKAIAQLKPAASFATVVYNGIHTYFFVDAKGERHPFRYCWVPRAGSVTLSPAESRALPGQYLLDEMRTRVGKGPVQWDLTLQFPGPADALDDASRAWPAERRTLLAGTLTVSSVDSDQRAGEPWVFDPTNVVPGLERSEDPLLAFRASVYSESYRRRAQETRQEPPPPDMGQ
jgi:catalase